MPASVDFGVGREAPRLRGAKAAIVAASVILGVAGVAAYFGAAAVVQDASDRADVAAWTVDGPPCPQISAAVYRSLALRQPEPFSYEGIRGVRAHGYVSCYLIDEDHGRHVALFPVCQLNAPFVVAVETPHGATYFEPGVGRPATLSAPNGQLRCVMGANDANF
jgi:hypothetical protein